MTDVVELSCQELVELVTDYLERALEPAALRRFEQHVSGCGNCTRYLAQMRQTIEVTGALSPEDITPEAERALLAVFSGWSST
jgi:anti-sigma factor RsiW